MAIPLNTNRDEVNHFNRLEKYSQKVEHIYRASIKDFVAIAAGLHATTDKPFSFSNFPKTKQRIANLIKNIAGNVEATIKSGIYQEWSKANDKADAIVSRYFKTVTNKKGVTFRRYLERNNEALKSFIERKEKGLGLSDRVWKQTEQFKKEIELALDLGIADGKSAIALARDVKKSLANSEILLKEFTNKHGIKGLRQVAEIANPGQGVYRSATKNAMRLTRTETNMAYRASDYTRWQGMDFIVGYEVRLSNAQKHCPLCAAFAGKYPKAFKFTGWHPQCMCFTVPIMMTDEEMNQLEDAMLEGKEINISSKNAVKDVPAGFRDFVADNKEKLSKAKNLPYFIRDNFAATKKGFIWQKMGL